MSMPFNKRGRVILLGSKKTLHTDHGENNLLFESMPCLSFLTLQWNVDWVEGRILKTVSIYFSEPMKYQGSDIAM